MKLYEHNRNVKDSKRSNQPRKPNLKGQEKGKVKIKEILEDYL